MASVQEPSLVKLYIKKPNGNLIRILQERVEFLAPGGSADHVVSSTATPEKLIRIPPKTSVPINRGDELVISVTLDASDGVDVSDNVYSLPFLDSTGGKFVVTDADFTQSDVTPAAATETILGRYEFTQGPFVFGGGPIFLSIEDDTA